MLIIPFLCIKIEASMITRDIASHYSNVLRSEAANWVISLFATALNLLPSSGSRNKLNLEYCGLLFKRRYCNCTLLFFIKHVVHLSGWSVLVIEIVCLAIGFFDFCLSTCVKHVDHAAYVWQTEGNGCPFNHLHFFFVLHCDPYQAVYCNFSDLISSGRMVDNSLLFTTVGVVRRQNNIVLLESAIKRTDECRTIEYPTSLYVLESFR